MAGLLQTSQPIGERFALPASNAPGNIDVIVADGSALPAGVVAPFRGNYYVDPLFAGVQTGSQSNPFTTIAAAFAFALASAVPNGIVYLAPTPIAENVTFPTSGEWDLVGTVSPGNLIATVLTGTVAMNATASCRRWIRDLVITGNVTGNTSAGVQRITFERVTVSGTTTLTVTGAGVVRLATLGGVPTYNLGATANPGWNFLIGAVAVQGTVWGLTTQFGSTLSCSGRCIFTSCAFLGNITTTAEQADDNDLVFWGCQPLAAIAININQTVPGRLALVSGTDTSFDSTTVNFSGVGINVFTLDQPSSNSFSAHGGTVTGAVVPATLASARLTGQVANLGATTFAFKNPIPQMRVNASLTLVTPGTAGAAQMNVTYTDTLGVVRTKPVGPTLNIAGAAGDEVSGSLVFTQNGSGNFNYSVTGIVTPGALSYNLAISIEAAL